jgi:hypothetical protein
VTTGRAAPMSEPSLGARPFVDRAVWLAVTASWLFCLVLAFSANPHGEDLIAEQMVGRALADGISPYVTLAELHDVYGGPVDWEWIHPRTPAALALVVPLGPIPTSALINVMTVVNVTAMLAVVLMSASLAHRSIKVAVLLFPLLLASEPGGQMIQHANLSPLIGLAVVWTWWSMRAGDSWIGGLPLGIAASARIFPTVLALVLLVGGRRKAGVAALVAAVVFNAAALLIPGVSISGSIEALGGAEQFLAHSNSFSIPGVVVRLGAPFSMGVVLSFALPVLLGLWILARRPPWERGLLLGAPLMLLVNQTSWPHYLTNVGPSVARLHRYLIALVVALWYAPLIGAPISLSIMGSLLVAVVGLALGQDASQERAPLRRSAPVVD